MSNFLTSSIGKKVILSLSGLFLIAFLCVHLALNLLLIVDNSGELFNIGAHFMATNPIIKIVEPILAIGFIIHIILASILTLQNRGARPIKYDLRRQSGNCTWSSRNMYILGGLVLIFLFVHLWNFWWKIKFAGDPLLTEINVDGTTMENTYALVSGLFKSSIIYCFLYILGGIFLGLHLTHGFWSAFQSIGFCNQIWRKRLECLAKIFAFIIAAGFSIIPLYFMLGLPTETEDDMKGIAHLAQKIAETYYEVVPKEQRKGKVQINVSTSFFVPKPFTPFQWAPMFREEDFIEKAKVVKNEIRSQLNQRSIRYNWHEPDVTVLEGFLARGDRRCADVILKAYEKGALYDAWSESFHYDIWKEAFRETGVDIEFYTLRERSTDEILPWDFIDAGVTKKFLIREWEQAKAETVTPNCRQKCSGCGVLKYKGGVCCESKN